MSIHGDHEQTSAEAPSIPNSTHDAAVEAVQALSDRTDPFAVVDAVLGAIADRTSFHRNRVVKVQAEAAVAIRAAELAESRRIREILGFDKPDTKSIVTGEIDLGMGTWVIEVEDGPFDTRYTYTAIVSGKSCHTYFAHKDEALLYAIEARNSGENGGYVFAARALGVSTVHDA